MLDVSRNFTKKDDLLKLIDILAHYKVNRLHLHFGDDEGWRVEMDGLPELTSYGAYRGIPTLNEDGTISEPDALMYTYCVTPDRNDTQTTGNGFYTQADYIEILKYADAHHMLVVPEFDIPGHSRAAVKSMEYRFRTTGDATYRLWDPADTSKYNSAQDYCDNVIDVSLPSTYAFIEKVFDNLIALHAKAGVPLEAVHIGGDEVPDGSWAGSPSCQALMKENGVTDVDWLKDYFTNRVLDIAEARGVKIAGWQEVAQHLEPATYERVKRNLAFTNFWAVSRGRDKIGYTFANDGVPVVLSNSSNAYFDLAYNWSKTERGHSWAGFIDERRSFSFLPYDLYKSVRWDDKGQPTELATASDGKPALTAEGKPYILGVQGQLWSETLRNFDHVTYYLFPKAVGLFERGWNAAPAWAETTQPDDPAFVTDFDRFFTIIAEREYPYYESLGISWSSSYPTSRNPSPTSSSPASWTIPAARSSGSCAGCRRNTRPRSAFPASSAWRRIGTLTPSSVSSNPRTTSACSPRTAWLPSPRTTRNGSPPSRTSRPTIWGPAGWRPGSSWTEASGTSGSSGSTMSAGQTNAARASGGKWKPPASAAPSTPTACRRSRWSGTTSATG